MTEFEHAIVSLNGDVSGRARLTDPTVTVVSPERAQGFGRLRALGKFLLAQRPDLLVTYGWGGTDAVFAARLMGLRPALHIEDGFLPDEALGQKFARKQVRRLAFQMAAGLVVPSRTLERIARMSWWLRASQVQYIPNGVDTDRFAPASSADTLAARRRLGVAPDEIVIGTVGMLRPDKNHARLIRVFSSLSRQVAARLVIVGDGDCRAALEQLAGELSPERRVTFAGSATDPAPYYRAFDVFALSSDTEQMPLSVLEAMAAGLPVVSTDVGDVADMIEPPAGGLVSLRGDDRALEESLLRFCREDKARLEAGAANRKRALDQFSLAGMIESYRQRFRRHLTSNRTDGH